LYPNIRPKKSRPKSLKRRNLVHLGLGWGIENKIKIGKNGQATFFVFLSCKGIIPDLRNKG
jgi:hypothetical protein